MNKSNNQGTEMLYLVHKEGEKHGFLTTSLQMAYEVRKGADSNVYFANGTPCPAAVKFCEEQDLNANYQITEFSLSQLNVGLIVTDLKEVSSGLVHDYKTPFSLMSTLMKSM